MLFISIIFVSLIAISAVSAADADVADVVALSDADDSDVMAVDNGAEQISVEDSDVMAVDKEAEPVSADASKEADVLSAGNGTTFDFGNGTTFTMGNGTFDISSLLNGTTFNFGNGTTMNLSDLLNGSTLTFGNGTTFSFGNGTTFTFGNGTGNGTTFDLSSILGTLGGDTKETIEASDVSKYYTKTTTLKATVKKGNETLSTGSVIFTVNNKEYVGHIGSDGVASVSLKALKPGTYYVFAEYGQTVVKNTIKIKKSIITKNVSKKYKKAGKFTVKILNSKGKPYAKQTVKVKFKGKTYKLKTNSKGIATLKLSKKLKVGKYTVKTTYAGLTLTNKITVKK